MMLDDRVLLVWWCLVLGLAGVLLLGFMTGSVANFLLGGTVLAWVGARLLVR